MHICKSWFAYLALIGIALGTFAFAVPFVGKQLESHEMDQRISKIKGKAEYIGGYLHLEFDGQFVKHMGDTKIYTTLITPENIRVSLDPIFIPNARAVEESESRTLLLSLLKASPFLKQDKTYAIEVYIYNSHSLFSKSVSLGLIPFSI